MQVGRALSFNKTPSKLKRAMSSMISPFGSQSNLTPASQLAQMRLASCNNINVSICTRSLCDTVYCSPRFQLLAITMFQSTEAPVNFTFFVRKPSR